MIIYCYLCGKNYVVLMKNRLLRYLALSVTVVMIGSCAGSDNADGRLRSQLAKMAGDAAAQVGIAVILPDGDTITVNNSDDYPLMSVFKLHEAIAVGRTMSADSEGFDSIIILTREDMSPDTWSPMAKDYPDGADLTVGKVMDYMLVYSDNNASNILFDKIVSVADTDSVIKSLDITDDFELRHTEREMQLSHDLAYLNRSSPLACAYLIKAALTDSLMLQERQKAIIDMLGACQSANDRIAAGLKDVNGAKLYHRTGSGYTNERGEIIAVNDVAFVELPDGRNFTLAVLIKDYAGEQGEASALIASIAAEVGKYLCGSR